MITNYLLWCLYWFLLNIYIARIFESLVIISSSDIDNLMWDCSMLSYNTWFQTWYIFNAFYFPQNVFDTVLLLFSIYTLYSPNHEPKISHNEGEPQRKREKGTLLFLHEHFFLKSNSTSIQWMLFHIVEIITHNFIFQISFITTSIGIFKKILKQKW